MLFFADGEWEWSAFYLHEVPMEKSVHCAEHNTYMYKAFYEFIANANQLFPKALWKLGMVGKQQWQGQYCTFSYCTQDLAVLKLPEKYWKLNHLITQGRMMY